MTVKDNEIEVINKPLTLRQKKFAKVFKNNLGHISKTCDTIGISRRAFYNWMENPNFVALIEDEKEALIDFVENKLITNIKNGDTTSTIFFLKTKGRERGYIERHDVNLKGIHAIKVLMNDEEIIDEEN